MIWEIWPVFITMILVVLKDKLMLIIMLISLITVGVATLTPNTYIEILYYVKHFLEQGISHRSL